jgi:hypothetical protein
VVDVRDDRDVAELHLIVLKKISRPLQEMLHCSNPTASPRPVKKSAFCRDLECATMLATLAFCRGPVMRYLLAFISVFCLLSPVSAQEVEQTPENAQKFLSLIGESRDVKINFSRHRWPDFSAEYRVQFSRAGECATQVDGKPFAYFDGAWRYEGTSNFDARFKSLMQRHTLAGPPWTIDWTKVGSITIVDGLIPDSALHPGQVIVVRYGGKAFVQFVISDQATAKRVHYAMEFLRVACDRTAETGF